MIKWILIGIIILGALLRFPGISYGLPLRLIADEPQFVLGAIQMVISKTLILSSADNFALLLYSPPYLLYLLWLPFYFLFYGLEILNFTDYFLIARFLSIAAGLTTVWLTYRVAKRLFPESREAPYISAYLMATSLLAITVSTNARHWSFATFIGICGLAALIQVYKPFPKRFLRTSVIAGIGMGFNQVVGILLTAFATCWYFIKENGSIQKLLQAGWFYKSIGIFAILAVTPLLIYVQSWGGIRQEHWGYAFTIFGFLTAPFQFLAPFIRSEPVFAALVAVGLTALWFKERSLFWVFTGTILGYTELFYLLYQFLHRFVSILLPFFAIIAGFGAAWLWTRFPKPWNVVLIGILLIMPALASLRLSYMMYRDDSRAQARAWFEDHIPADSKVIVWGELTRLTSTQKAVYEKILLNIDIDADDSNEFLRTDVRWGRVPFHALNLFTVSDEKFYDGIKNYACKKEYGYLIAQTSPFQSERQTERVMELTKNAETLATFGVSDENFSITSTTLDGWPWSLFTLPEFGPPIKIYKINHAALCL